MQDFLSTCRRPAVLEHGDELMPLNPDNYLLELRTGRLWIEIFGERRSLCRRILAIDRHAPGVLDCTVQLFGGKTGTLAFLDLDRPQTACRTLRGERLSFAERFRRMLQRQFPGWEVEMLSTGMDLQHSLSPRFPRAKLTRGIQTITAIGCPAPEHETDLLTAALIWHDRVRTRAAPNITVPLCFFLPDGAGVLTAHRLRWLRTSLLAPRLFRFNAHGSAGEVDPADLGNVETAVSAAHVSVPLSQELSTLLSRLTSIDGVSLIPELSGALSIRCRGIEFARLQGGELLYGIETKVPAAASDKQVEQLACQLSELSRTAAGGSATPLARPERWLECCVRAKLSAIDASLLESPVHGQVLMSAAADRDAIDLLAVSRHGRLAVLELKTVEDIHLPVQALDYWMRVARHAERRELDHLFPAVPLVAEPPRLLLIAPAICFHPSNRTVLQYFSSSIEVERIGINSDWQRDLRVVLRLNGAEAPLSHRSSV
ncbi:MAG TPA: hypothetical protein VG168_15045 [Bryobacteraceae bacterium]|nr:hypothetical protein [Bryobacteraceae bacterium]